MIHQTLTEIRKERKMSIQQVSDITNIPFRTIERWSPAKPSWMLSV